MDIDKHLAAIKARCDAATKGPWYDRGSCVSTNDEEPGYPPRNGPIASLDDGEYIENKNDGDAAFIAASRTDVPRLVAAVEYLRMYIEPEDQEAVGRWVAAILAGEEDDESSTG